ncbi:MAG: hypothetical protein U0V02_08145 [Anaerolineales bacterium]
MNKLDVSTPSMTVSTASFSNLQPARRLIVLVPSLELDPTPLVRRVWELAKAKGVHVQFLGLYSDPSQESSLKRELITMAAMIRDENVSAGADAIFGKDWVDVVRSRAQADDTVICLAEHRVGLSHRPLSQILQSELQVSLYILSDLYPHSNSRSKLPSQIAVWIGSAAIIFGFSLLQIKMDPLAKDWAHTALLLISILVELWMIWGWNSLFA